MIESIESMPVDQLREVLLSDDFQEKLADDIWSYDSFGLAKTTQELTLTPSLLQRFLDITPEFISTAESNQRRFSPRISSHIRRLTDPNRTLPENYFGLLCAYYGVGKDGYSKLPKVAGGEGIDTTFFWSLAPYIAQELRYYEVPPSQIVESIFKWGKKANNNDSHLTGTSDFYDLNAFHSSGLILTKNHDGHSHKFAHGLSRILCEKIPVFKDIIAKNNPMRVRDTSRTLNLLDK